jgi:hypothetical protein
MAKLTRPPARAKVYSRVEDNPFTPTGKLRVWYYETRLGSEVVHADDTGDFAEIVAAAHDSASAFSYVASTGHPLSSWREIVDAEDDLAALLAERDAQLDQRVQRVRERFARQP